MKTAFFTAATTDRNWYVIDAAGKPLGRVAAKVASILRGKTSRHLLQVKRQGIMSLLSMLTKSI